MLYGKVSSHCYEHKAAPHSRTKCIRSHQVEDILEDNMIYTRRYDRGYARGYTRGNTRSNGGSAGFKFDILVHYGRCEYDSYEYDPTDSRVG